MKPATLARTPRYRQRGVAAVEFAILATLLIMLLGAPLYIGRVLWQYTAVQKAAHDAALYLSTIPDVELRTPSLAPAATAVANAIVAAELSDVDYGEFPPAVTVQCDGNNCTGYTVPTIMRVYVETRIQDPFFGAEFGGDSGFLVTAEAEMLYIGSQ